MYQALFLIVFIIFGVFSAGETFAQTSGATQKTQEIAAALAKTKYKHKVKKNFEFELYIDIKNEPIVKNAAEYAGVYESEDAGYRIELRASGGKVEGSGYETAFENSARSNFTLSDARIEGALLTATKVYTDGSTKRLEAVFVNRTVTTGTNPNKIASRDTKFGLGFVEIFNENSRNRIFCEYRP